MQNVYHFGTGFAISEWFPDPPTQDGSGNPQPFLVITVTYDKAHDFPSWSFEKSAHSRHPLTQHDVRRIASSTKRFYRAFCEQVGSNLHRNTGRYIHADVLQSLGCPETWGDEFDTAETCEMEVVAV